MKYSFNSILSSQLFLIVLSVAVMSCGDDEKVEICSPQSVITGGDSVVYVYNNENRLSEIQFRSKTTIHQRDVMTYSNGDLVGFTKTYPQPSGPAIESDHFVFVYGSNKKPSILIYYQNSTATTPTDSVVYFYDEKDRLVRRDLKINGLVFRRTRYEYTADNNVAKIYYVDGPGSAENLGAEFYTFDSHERFFAGSPDLELIETYIFDYQPSVNNLLSCKMYEVSGSIFGVPQNVNYTVFYNDKGYVNIIQSNNPYASSEFTFSTMKYTCQ